MTSLINDLNLLREMTPLGIRDLLVTEGVKGVRGDPDSCPIARWLDHRHPRIHSSVSVLGIEIWDEGCMSEYPTPESVKDFMGVFDMGGYPEVDEESL
jgi:hypothetical protein